MLKSDLVNILIEKRGVTQKQAEATVETIFETMKEALCRGENIEIRGLGAFHVKSYEGYQGRNPKTGQIIPVKPKRGLLFRTGKELRDRVNRPPAVQANTVTGTASLNEAANPPTGGMTTLLPGMHDRDNTGSGD
jgi:integration host factor subunit beta